MKKSFYPGDIMEFKLNNKWIRGSLKNIIKSENKYIISLENSSSENFEHKNSLLIFNNFSIETIFRS